jgi:hypothetical protein
MDGKQSKSPLWKRHEKVFELPVEKPKPEVVITDFVIQQ